MTSYVPIVKNNANGAIFYISLVPRTANGQWQSNPTLAAGDVKISLDGGALANLNTLPAVTPASSKLVKVTLSQAETNADNIAIVFSDAAGAEWCDLTVNLQTAAKQFDDLATQASVDAIDDYVDTEVAAIKAKTDQLTFTVASQVDVNVVDWKGAAAPAMTGDAYARLGAPVGASISADIAGVQADTDNIQTRLPAALVSGRIDASVGAMANDVVTAAAIAADAIGSSELAASAVTEIQSGLSTLDAAGVRAAVGLASANLDTQLDALPTTAEVNAEVDAALADAGVTSARLAHLDADVSSRSTYAGTDTAGTTTLLGRLTATRAGNLDNLDVAVSSRLADAGYTAPPSAATIAQAVWDALTAALTTVGSIGKLLVTNIDAAVTSRLASGSYTAPDNAGIASIDGKATTILAGVAAIDTKTANLPDDPADQSLIIDATTAIMGRLGAPAGATLSADVAAVKGDTAAVRAQTDQLAFTGGAVDANVAAVNGTQVTGDGTTGNEWGPA